MRKVALLLPLVVLLSATVVSAQTWQKPSAAFSPGAPAPSLPLDMSATPQTKNAELKLKTLNLSALGFNGKALELGANQTIGNNSAQFAIQRSDGTSYIYNSAKALVLGTRGLQLPSVATSSLTTAAQGTITYSGGTVYLRSTNAWVPIGSGSTGGSGSGSDYWTLTGTDLHTATSVQAVNIDNGGLVITDKHAAGFKYLTVGDDTFFTDVDVVNTLGLYGNQDAKQASLKLGSAGPLIIGKNANVGIGSADATPKTKLDVWGSLTLSRAEGTSVVAGAGPSLILESPSNSGMTSQLNPDPPVPCGGSGQAACGTDNTPSADSDNMYTCPSGSGGRTYSNDVGRLGGSAQRYKAAITCIAGTASYSVRANDGALEFSNGAATTFVIKQDGKVGILTTAPQAELDVEGWIRSQGIRSNVAQIDGNLTVSGNLIVNSIVGSPVVSGPITAPQILLQDANGKKSVFDGTRWLPHGTKTKTCAVGTQGGSGYATINDGKVDITICRNSNCTTKASVVQLADGDQRLTGIWYLAGAPVILGSAANVREFVDVQRHVKLYSYSTNSGNLEGDVTCDFN